MNEPAVGGQYLQYELNPFATCSSEVNDRIPWIRQLSLIPLRN